MADPLNALTPEEVGFVLAATLLKEGPQLTQPERCHAALVWLANLSRSERARALARLAHLVNDPIPRNVHPSWIADAWAHEPADLRSALSPEAESELTRAVLAPLSPPLPTSASAAALIALPPDELRARAEAGLPLDLSADDRRAIVLRLPIEIGRRLLET